MMEEWKPTTRAVDLEESRQTVGKKGWTAYDNVDSLQEEEVRVPRR
jgi:hypothetical protein